MNTDHLINFSPEQQAFIRDLNIDSITHIKTKVKEHFVQFTDDECTTITGAVIIAMSKTISQFLLNQKGIDLEVYRSE